MHEALGNLEEVTVWLIRCEIDIEYEWIICLNLLSLWLNFEWIRYKLSSCLVEDWEQCPINQHWESEIVLQRDCLWFTHPAMLCEGEINRVCRKSKLLKIRWGALQHLLVKGDLAWIIDWNLEMKIWWNVNRPHEWVVLVIYFFHNIRLLVCSHDDFVPVRVYVALTERDWLREDVIAGANQINVQDFMIPDHAEHSFIIVARLYWIECDYYSWCWIFLHHAFRLREWEHIAFICDELESCLQVTWIDHIKKSICVCIDLDLSEVDGLDWKIDIIALGKTFSVESNLVPSKRWDFELGIWVHSWNLWCVADSYLNNLSRCQISRLVVDFYWRVFAIIWDFLDYKLCRHHWRILQLQHSRYCFAN